MKENSIEKDIEIVENILHKGYTMSILHPSTNIKESEIKVLEHILSDYKRVLKENEELHKEIDRTKSLDIYKLVKDWETGQLIPIQKIKDKIEELKINLVNMQGEELLIYESKIEALQELLEKEK